MCEDEWRVDYKKLGCNPKQCAEWSTGPAGGGTIRGRSHVRWAVETLQDLTATQFQRGIYDNASDKVYVDMPTPQQFPLHTTLTQIERQWGGDAAGTPCTRRLHRTLADRAGPPPCPFDT